MQVSQELQASDLWVCDRTALELGLVSTLLGRLTGVDQLFLWRRRGFNLISMAMASGYGYNGHGD